MTTKSAALLSTSLSTADEPLPDHLVELLTTLAPMLDRPDAAAALRQHLGIKVSARTLESWALPWRLVNGHALAPTEAYFRLGWRKIAEAPVVQGGRRAASVHAVAP